MLKQRTLALVAGIAAAGILATAASAWADGGHRKGWKGHHGHGERMFRMMESFDLDGDGKVSQAEIDQARKDRFAKYDTDGDGRLSLQEYEALWLDAMRERIVRQFQRHDRDGDAQVTVDEFVGSTGRLAARLDRNRDGVVDEADKRRPRKHEDRGPRQDRR